jgi:VWFA-related protein
LPQPKASLIRLVVMVTLCAPVTSLALSSQPQTPKPGQTASASQAAPVPTFHSTSRIVTLEISAKDKHGKAISGLKASDFQVFEHELGFRKEKQEQKIAFFREVDKKLLAERDTSSLQIPAGIFTNLVTLQKNPVPPTILLVDGLNTEMTAQMQVHVQMVKMLHSLPSDVPVAVFLLGRGLKILQGFTTDPALLRTALAKAAMPTLGVGSQVDPRDDPDSLSTLMGDMPVSETALSAIQSFEQEQYVSTMDMRVRETVTALISIAHHVAGYPGRKNLLWISSSFPVSLNADGSAFNSFRSYENDMREVSAVLADAKVAVYPIDPGGFKKSQQRARCIGP